MEDIPDLVEPIVGWRAWRIYPGFDEMPHMQNTLLPMGFRIPWMAMRPSEARCVAVASLSDPAGLLRVQPPDHVSPMADCSCGYYALRKVEYLALHFREYVKAQESGTATYDGGLPVAIGRVYLWGKVFLHEWGYRAQFAYPKTIIARDNQLACRLASYYRCYVEASCNWEDFWETLPSSPSLMSRTHLQQSQPLFPLIPAKPITIEPRTGQPWRQL